MSVLSKEWHPEFGTIFTWFAIDKNNRIAMMVNNGYGELPKVLLGLKNVEALLDRFSEFVWGESSQFSNLSPNKEGELNVDLYSAWRYRDVDSKEGVAKYLEFDLTESRSYSEASVSVNRGFFVYHGVEGDTPEVDYPVGYSGVTEMGDYFRYLVPTILSGIDDIPKALHLVLVKSDSFDFEKDQLLRNDQVDYHFSRIFC